LLRGQPQPSLDSIKSEYLLVEAQLKPHVPEFDVGLDDDPLSPQLLDRKWQLTARWVAAWLDAHPGLKVEAALAEIDPSAEPDYVALSATAFLVVAPGPMASVFIVAKRGERYEPVWSIAQPHHATGRQAETLAAWRPENAREGRRGPYWAASGHAGPLSFARTGRLPDDAQGRARFYIDATYAQAAGATVGAQITLWTWDGSIAVPQLAREYGYMIDQRVGTRLEGNLLKVQQKKQFRMFSLCGACEGRQVDWIVRLTSNGLEDLGETSTLPEVDAIDELLYRLVNRRPAVDIASPAAIRRTQERIDEARAGQSAEQWRGYPKFGLSSWTVSRRGNQATVCLAPDDFRPTMFSLTRRGARFFITDAIPTRESCPE
jgi:hypothetical protein